MQWRANLLVKHVNVRPALHRNRTCQTQNGPYPCSTARYSHSTSLCVARGFSACELGRTGPACHARHFRTAPPPRRRWQLGAPNTSTTASGRPLSCCPKRALGFGGTRSKIRPSARTPNPNSIGKYGHSPRARQSSPLPPLTHFAFTVTHPSGQALSLTTLATPPPPTHPNSLTPPSDHRRTCGTRVEEQYPRLEMKVQPRKDGSLTRDPSE